MPANHLEPIDNIRQYNNALSRGVISEPGEALTPNDRRKLIFTLWSRGWTDSQISDWTGWTLYTTARLRDDLLLRQHRNNLQEVA